MAEIATVFEEKSVTRPIIKVGFAINAKPENNNQE